MANLTPAQQKFIIHWGEMGERWGINRTVAQIHALLYLSNEPLSAEQISQSLTVARSTVSTGLHELQAWGIIRVVPRLGERTDYFEALGDVWEMARKIVDRRIQMELNPTLKMLCEVTQEPISAPDEAHSQARMADMLDLLETASSLYDQTKKIPTRTLVRMAKMGDVLRKVLGLLPNA